MILVPQPRSVRASGNIFQGDVEIITKHNDDSLSNEHYRLVVSPKEINLYSSGESGFFYGERTLKQLLLQSDEKVPCVEIEDGPDFETRGFMLDISRCQVPTLKTLFQIIDTLADFKINQLQLYTEHTFAYPGHELIWGDASPLTAEDIQALDLYCKDKFIDLVPNQNSFGHMERWLQYPEYCFLAESPQGFIHPESQKHCSPSVLKPNGESLAFLKKLYQALLPHFTSKLFNVGFDEPWELGRGWSKQIVESEGKHQVYLRFLNDVHNLACQHKRQMLFWADIAMERPDLIHQIPEDAIPVIWGYESDSPFEEQCQLLEEAGRTYYVAPGTSTWNSFSGRLDNALSNLKSAARAGIEHKAAGYLITSWGDNGNHQPWSTLYPPLMQGAASAWNEEAGRSLKIEPALNQILFQDKANTLGQAICMLGRIENNFSGKLKNKSFNHCFFFDEDKDVEEALNKVSPLEMGAQTNQLDEIDNLITTANIPAPYIHFIKEDLHVATDMIRWANKRALSTLPSSESPHLRSELKRLIGRYKERWLTRNRPGGLHESANYLRKML